MDIVSSSLLSLLLLLFTGDNLSAVVSRSSERFSLCSNVSVQISFRLSVLMFSIPHGSFPPF